MVRRPCRELAGAGIHGLEDGHDPERRATGTDLGLRMRGEHRDPRVGQPRPLGRPQVLGREDIDFFSLQRKTLLDHLGDLIDEPRIDR